MKFLPSISRRSAAARCAVPLWFEFLTILALVFSAPSYALSQIAAGDLHPPKSFRGKLSPELKRDESAKLYDVIVQFRTVPSQAHYERVRAKGGYTNRSLHVIKAASFRLTARAIQQLSADPSVAYISLDRKLKKSSDDYTTAAVMADIAHSQFAVDGSGIGIAIIDSGVSDHADLRAAGGLASRVVYNESFVVGDAGTADAYGHGTHVAGTAAGNGASSLSGYSQNFAGVAPNANIINLRVLDANGAGSDSLVIAAIERAIQLKAVYNIRVLNLSLGRPIYESYTLDPLCQAVEAAWKAGIVVITAAGNQGRNNSFGSHGYGTIEAPGNDPYVITVGATNTVGTMSRSDDVMATFSSKGPTAIDHIVKPDVVAPGNRTVSLNAGGNALAAANLPARVFPSGCDLLCASNTEAAYLQLSGTSMATPVVSGAAALLLQNDPTLTPDQVKAKLMKTAWKSMAASNTSVVLGVTYTTQTDIFTSGAGMLDIGSALANQDHPAGVAVSPVATFHADTGIVTVSHGDPLVLGNSVVWDDPLFGNSVVWDDALNGNSVVWDDGSVVGTSVVWGDSVVWDDSLTSESVVWDDSVVWDGDGWVDDGY